MGTQVVGAAGGSVLRRGRSALDLALLRVKRSEPGECFKRPSFIAAFNLASPATTSILRALERKERNSNPDAEAQTGKLRGSFLAEEETASGRPEVHDEEEDS